MKEMPEFTIRRTRNSAKNRPTAPTASRRPKRQSSASPRKREQAGASTRAVDTAATAPTEISPIAHSGTVRDGYVLDFISGAKEVKETAKESVRQRIARALFHEYAISVVDMEADYPVVLDGKRRRADIAVFGADKVHTQENIQRIVVCRPEPKQNKRGAVKLRDYEQAEQDLAEVKPFFAKIDDCKYALWANVNILTSLLFLKKKPADVVKREAMVGAADYPVFMAVAERVGFDRRGSTLYKRSPDGQEITEEEEYVETITVGERKVSRRLRRKKSVVDDDLPRITERYHAFRQEHPEPRA